MSLSKLSNLGVGIGFRESFRADLFLHQTKIDFLEITADHYFDAGPKKTDELKLLAQHFPLVPHGLNLSLGSAEGIDDEYLEKFAVLIETVQPEWFSEHISFTKSGGIEIGHLAPVPFTKEALGVLVKNISKVKKRILTPLILENITYMMRFPSSEMTESRFIRTLVEETDCGLLLDVTNLFINAKNFSYDWQRYLDEIPMERVVQLHFVGLHRSKDRLIDAHGNKTQPEIWEVFREVCSRTDIKGAILERDENFPPFAEILEEIQTARQFVKNAAEAVRISSGSGVLHEPA
jgi:uncharacterized protein (UPF0276 family)